MLFGMTTIDPGISKGLASIDTWYLYIHDGIQPVSAAWTFHKITLLPACIWHTCPNTEDGVISPACSCAKSIAWRALLLMPNHAGSILHTASTATTTPASAPL
jgi:hypothetical protein